jgi:hypothetical protein
MVEGKEEDSFSTGGYYQPSGNKSPVSIALNCTTSRQILASVSTNQGNEKRRSDRALRAGGREAEFFIDNLLDRIHLIIAMILVDRPCAIGVLNSLSQVALYLPS